MKPLIIIPAFNEENSILNLMNELNKYEYDYIIINDCSTDDTKKILDTMHLNHLDLPINIGLAGVTQIGFKYALDNNYDSAIVLDGDGQHPPRYVEMLLKELEKGYDYILGSRFLEKKKEWNLRMLGSRIISFVIRLKTGIIITDPTSGMRALGKKVIADFAYEMNFINESDALAHILKKGFNVREIQVTMDDRMEGQSYFNNLFKSCKFMVNVLISILFIQ